MGSCCGRPKVKQLQKGTLLYDAQQMTTTLSGHEITKKVGKRVLTKEEHEKLCKDPKTPADFRLILNPPFSLVNKITDFLYLTGIGGLTKENFKKFEITLIINATYEWPNTQTEGIECIRVPVDDGVEDDLTPYLDEVSDKIEEVARSGGKTLVHCMAGASRSTTLVLAYLIKYEHISLRNAFKSVKKRRETARPNVAFFQQLINYEIRTRGKSSVRMIQVSNLGVTVIVPDFYEKEHPDLFRIETEKQILAIKSNHSSSGKTRKSQFEDVFD